MPIAMEVRMVFRIQSGVTLVEICCCLLGARGLKIVDMNAEIERPDGRNQRFRTKMARSSTLVTSRVPANSRDRNVSSPMNLQFVVHLNRKTLPRSKDLARYPRPLVRRNGSASVNCI